MKPFVHTAITSAVLAVAIGIAGSVLPASATNGDQGSAHQSLLSVDVVNALPERDVAPLNSSATSVEQPALATSRDNSSPRVKALTADEGRRHISEAKARDPKGYARRLARLASNSALTSLLDTYVPGHTAEQLAAMAATADDAQVEAFMTNTAGKVFVPVSVDGEWGLQLVTRDQAQAQPQRLIDPSGPIALPGCWQAWVAAYAWTIGVAGLCAGIGLLTFIAGGFICGAVAWTAGMVINWNNAC